ncbi:hypothetical protein CULT_1870004 [[Clostridium] ultunense Esp]|nr:hypothetical protein CULT_1870004 [[Clostridium] ultunense Esp]
MRLGDTPLGPLKKKGAFSRRHHSDGIKITAHFNPFRYFYDKIRMLKSLRNSV